MPKRNWKKCEKGRFIIDIELILGVMMMVAVAAAVILIARRYQRVREKTGYQRGRYYRFRQHMGAFFGNKQMNKLGLGNENSDGRIETNDEMFYFSEKNKED